MRYSFYDILTQYNPMEVSGAYYKYYDDVAIYLENYVEENLEDVAGFPIEVKMALYMYFSDTEEINEEIFDEMLLELFQYI